MLEARIDDATLVSQLRNGDEGAYERLVRTYSGRVYGAASRVLGQGSDAEDAAQEAFLAAWKGIGGFDGRSALSTWLHRISVNTSLAILRSRSRKREVPITDPKGTEPDDRPVADTLPEIEDSRADPVEQADIARLVWEAIDELGEDYRLVLVMRDVEEMPSKEVAAALGLSDATVRQRLHRARQVVAERLRPELCAGRHLTCGGRLDLLLDWIDQDVAAELHTPVKEHIDSCPGCQDLLAGYRQMIAAPKRAWRTVAPEPDSEALIGKILAGTGVGSCSQA